MTSMRAREEALSVSRLRNLLTYDPETGLFTWKVSSRSGWVGKKAGSLTDEGYIVIALDGLNGYKASRLAWLMVYGAWPPSGMVIDHIDGCRTNNRIANLRLATIRENRLNSKTRSDSKSGMRGVRCRRGRWQARIFINGRDMSLGYFGTKEEAAAAYAEAARRHFGEFVGFR